MKRILNKCILSFLLLIIGATFLSGIYAGFQLGKESVCGDIAFYYNNDLPVKACIETVKKAAGK